MTGIIELDTTFQIPNFFKISDFENMRVHKHIYGNPMEQDPKEVYWVEYQPQMAGGGTISFARRLYLEYPETANYVVNYLSNLFPMIPFDIKRVNLLKTKGSIGKHVDESLRKCTINIGIKNSSVAITRTSPTTNFDLYDRLATNTICQDGHAYLLDTGSVHEVISFDDTQERFLFTYGFGRSFNEISQLCNI